MKRSLLNFRKWCMCMLVIALTVVAVGCSTGGKGSNGKKATNASQHERTDEGTDEPTVEEQVLVDRDGVRITLKGLSTDGFMGPEIQLLVENSSAVNVTVQTRDMSVNGFMTEPVFSCDVAAGKSANDSITLMDSELESAGIEKIMNFELSFHVFNSDNWDTLFDSDTVHVATSLDNGEVQAVDDSGILLLERDGIRLTVKEADSENSFWGADIYIYVENQSDKNITVQARDVSINGFMVQPMFSCDVAAGKKAYDTITFFESDLEQNGIESIDRMEISFHVFESSNFDTIFDSEAVAVEFE